MLLVKPNLVSQIDNEVRQEVNAEKMVLPLNQCRFKFKTNTLLKFVHNVYIQTLNGVS